MPSEKKLMHKNAIKIVWGGQKLCAFYQKYGTFWGEKIVRLFVRFLAKLGAPSSSEHLATLPANFLQVKSKKKKNKCEE